LKTAIVHDWFAGFAGSEKVVRSINNILPDADIYTLFDLLSDSDRKLIMNDKKPQTSFLQSMPFIKNNHRSYLPLFPYAIEQFDLSGYDLIVSSSHAVAKGVLTNSGQLHICYCHTPIRYAWDLTHQYLNEAGLKKGLKSFIARSTLHYIRMWDINSAGRPDNFIANSSYIAERIKKIYNRAADVIYPPVDVDRFEISENNEDYFVTASRLVPYKRVDLIVKAFAAMPDKKLIVVGDGPGYEKLKSIASSNVSFTGYLSTEGLNQYLKTAKAFIFAADEDFGIAPIEALACGTPVIAFNKGGTAETIINGKYGILFNEQTADSIRHAVEEFETNNIRFNPQELRIYAGKYSRQTFEEKISAFIKSKVKSFFDDNQ
jgi:glycosyltransferase involved in cell wall biosynthesis